MDPFAKEEVVRLENIVQNDRTGGMQDYTNSLDTGKLGNNQENRIQENFKLKSGIFGIQVTGYKQKRQQTKD